MNPAVHGRELTPTQTVAALDEYIVGQADAKRAIAVALRNRWRRMQLSEELKSECSPRNLLMVGPTGSGKTEISRRVAKLTNSPLVVAACTSYTEVGYHGASVDSIIKDLVAASAKLCQANKEAEYEDEVAEEVEKTLLDALTGKQATSWTQDEFRELLRAGELDSVEVEVAVPRAAGMDRLEFDVGTGETISVDPTELFRRLQGGAGGQAPKEQRRMKISEAKAALRRAAMDERLAGTDWKKEAVTLAEQHGIVFLDEIDKIVSTTSKAYRSGDASAEGVQRDLLPLIEGSTVDVKKFGPVRTDYILFIASGAFADAKPSDMLPELQGRLPIRVQLAGLTASDLYRILTEPKANIIEQQVALMAAEGVKLKFEDEAVREIAEQSATMNRTVENIGARRLYTVLEHVMRDISFEAADLPDGHEVTITKDTVLDRLKGFTKEADLKKFIL